MVHRPPAAAIHFASSFSPSYGKALKQGKQGLLALSQVAYIGRPVIHLQVNVERVSAAPWWVE
jgi:hypothetical protein